VSREPGALQRDDSGTLERQMTGQTRLPDRSLILGLTAVTAGFVMVGWAILRPFLWDGWESTDELTFIVLTRRLDEVLDRQGILALLQEVLILPDFGLVRPLYLLYMWALLHIGGGERWVALLLHALPPLFLALFVQVILARFEVVLTLRLFVSLSILAFAGQCDNWIYTFSGEPLLVLLCLVVLVMVESILESRDIGVPRACLAIITLTLAVLFKEPAISLIPVVGLVACVLIRYPESASHRSAGKVFLFGCATLGGFWLYLWRMNTGIQFWARSFGKSPFNFFEYYAAVFQSLWVPLALLPLWIVHELSALFLNFRWKFREHRLAGLLILWSLGHLVIHSRWPFLLPRYWFPPVCALLIAAILAAQKTRESGRTTIGNVVVAMLTAAHAVLLLLGPLCSIPTVSRLPTWIVGLLIVAGSALASLIWIYRNRSGRLLRWVSHSMMVLGFVNIVWIFAVGTRDAIANGRNKRQRSWIQRTTYDRVARRMPVGSLLQVHIVGGQSSVYAEFNHILDYFEGVLLRPDLRLYFDTIDAWSHRSSLSYAIAGPFVGSTPDIVRRKAFGDGRGGELILVQSNFEIVVDPIGVAVGTSKFLVDIVRKIPTSLPALAVEGDAGWQGWAISGPVDSP